jgi:hypothetical protein
MKTTQLNFISTASHGYLEVPFTTLWSYMNDKDISEYSFVDYFNKTFYLEEDCDAPLFIKKVKEKNNIAITESYLEDIPETAERLFHS